MTPENDAITTPIRLDELSGALKTPLAQPTNAKCRYCNKLFIGGHADTAQRMHEGRVHTKTIRTPKGPMKGKVPFYQPKEYRQAHYQKMQARYKREGKNSRGQPKTGLNSNVRKAQMA